MGNCLFNKKIYVEEYTDENYVLHEYQKKYKRNVKYRSKYWCRITRRRRFRPAYFDKAKQRTVL
jgi:hypothetical protein